MSLDEKFIIDVEDDRWSEFTDPAWQHRPSLFEMQMEDRLGLAFQIAANRRRQTESIHQLITRAIASMVPVEEVSNRELASILLGENEQDNKRVIRHFRNGERPLKLTTAAAFLQRLMYSKRILPYEAGRLWYAALQYSCATGVVVDYIRENKTTVILEEFQRDLTKLIADACIRFRLSLKNSIKKSEQQPLEGYPLNRIRHFMDFCAFIHWQESKVKRNPLVGIKRLIDLAPDFNEYSFEE